MEVSEGASEGTIVLMLLRMVMMKRIFPPFLLSLHFSSCRQSPRLRPPFLINTRAVCTFVEKGWSHVAPLPTVLTGSQKAPALSLSLTPTPFHSICRERKLWE